MKRLTLLDSLFIENEEDKMEETFDQSVIEKEVKKFYKNVYAKTPTYAEKRIYLNLSEKVSSKPYHQRRLKSLKERLIRMKLVNV